MTIDQLPIEEKYPFHVFFGKDGDKFLPRVDADEYFDRTLKKWGVMCGSTSFVPDHIYRRRIDPGPGWEIVPLDAGLKAGDEAMSRIGEWTIIEEGSFILVHEKTPLGTVQGSNGYWLAIRRRKQPEAKAGWIKVKDRLPEIKVPVIVCDTGGMRQVCLLLADDRKFVTHWGNDVFLNATHWQPLPAPPAPEINPDEEAFEEAYKDFTMPTYRMPDDPKVRARKFWNAARKEKAV